MHPEAIKSASRAVFDRLKFFKGFYLAGGTALALQIGHRLSVDFDLFSDQSLSGGLLNSVEQVYSGLKVRPSVNNPDQLTVIIGETQLTFLKYPFPPLFQLENFQGLKLLSIKEIAAAKADVIDRRATFKDYVDLYFIIKKGGITLEEIIQVAEKKYEHRFNRRLFLEQLIYFKDIPYLKIEFLQETVSRSRIKAYFREQVQKQTL